MQAVHADGPERLVGHVVPVHIDRVLSNSLTGHILVAAEGQAGPARAAEKIPA